jgi:hypothetical protein
MLSLQPGSSPVAAQSLRNRCDQGATLVSAIHPHLQMLWNSSWQQWLEAEGWGPTLDRSGFNV